MKKKVILAYSGGLDTSIILKWLIDKEYEVVCFLANIGQKEDFLALKDKALNLGATKVYIEDLREEFVAKFIFPALKSNALYEGKYLLGTALARPLIAKKQIEIAKQENTCFVSHGATGKGNDQVRFEIVYHSLMPDVQIISPWKEEEFLNAFQGRSDMIHYAHLHQIPITSTLTKPFSVDENLMHKSFEGGILEDPSQEGLHSIPSSLTSLYDAPDSPTQIAIQFEKGIPVQLIDFSTNKTTSGSGLEILEQLNALGAKNGIGQIDMVENRFIGIKSRGIYETPGGTILWKAHADLESLVLDREVMHLKADLSHKIAHLIYNGFWFSPEMKFLMAAIEQSQERVDGQVHLTLYKGNAMITKRSSSKALYSTAMSSMDVAGGYDQKDAKGFIQLNALRLKIGALS